MKIKSILFYLSISFTSLLFAGKDFITTDSVTKESITKIADYEAFRAFMLAMNSRLGNNETCPASLLSQPLFREIHTILLTEDQEIEAVQKKFKVKYHHSPSIRK